jgi:hypothetical protein
MVKRSTTTAFAVLVAMMLPVGHVLAQGAGGTTGIGNASGVNTAPGGAIGAPPGQSPPTTAPLAIQGFAAQEPDASRPGLAEPGADGVSTKIVPARPCSTAAHETDGTTTCVGIPGRR